MAKWYGSIGFSTQIETSPGIWETTIEEISGYTGDLITYSIKTQTDNSVNDGIVMANDISIIADPFISMNCGFIKYVTMNGIKWKVNSISSNFPKIDRKSVV